MEQAKNLSFRTRSIQLFFAAVLAVALLGAAVLPAGAQNTALGSGALQNNTTGTGDTALGGGALFANTTGNENTATGAAALTSNTTGVRNTATGFEALFSNTTGFGNIASGFQALGGNTTGGNNVASGYQALFHNTTGGDDTATGFDALFHNTTGNFNTATGFGALFSNTTGSENTAVGAALGNNTTGVSNTASGFQALESNTTGSKNTAVGEEALLFSSTNDENTAVGFQALRNNGLGGSNTALGAGALENTTGSFNIAIGLNAGGNLTSGASDIDIGNAGVAAESKTIRIGTPGTQTRVFIASVNSSPIVGSPVFVNASGRLGIQASSARFKRDIHDMGDASGELMKLRPVSFRYKEDPSGAQQYGLIAEEVERVYPELVTYGADGKVEAVAYHLLPAMLLNEIQKQARENRQKDARIAALQRQVDALKKERDQIDALSARLNAIEAQARIAKPERLAAAMR